MSLYFITILLPTLVLFTIAIVTIMKKYKGFIEEDYLGEVRLVSPAFKIVKNVIVKMFLSIEVLLILLAIYILSFMLAYTATFTYTFQVLDVEPQYNALLLKKDITSLRDIAELAKNHITVVQIFNPVEIDKEVYYALLVKCRIESELKNRSMLFQMLNKYCEYLKKGYVIVDANNTLTNQDLSKLLGKDKNINIIRLDLGEFVRLELAPGIYVVHSIGTIGGLSLKIEHKERILIMPLDEKLLNNICSNKDCETRLMVIGFDDVNIYVETLDKLVSLFDYTIIKKDGNSIVYSQTYVPTPRTILGMVLSLIISMLMMVAVGGSFIEKIVSMGNALFVIGITKDLFMSIVLLGTSLTMLIMILPIAVASWLGFINSIAVVNFILSAIGFIAITSFNLRSRIGKSQTYGFIPSYSYVVGTYIPPNVLVSCIKKFFVGDDFFHVGEIEYITEKGRHVIRIELVYRKALSTLSSVEIYMDNVDHGVRYTVIVDVWSMEDLSSNIMTSIQRLALSKTVGGIMGCIEG